MIAASLYGLETIIHLLLDKGADVNAICQNGYGTALCAASSFGFEAIVRLLLDKGTGISVEGPRGTALRVDYDEDQKAIAQILVDHGGIYHKSQSPPRSHSSLLSPSN